MMAAAVAGPTPGNSSSWVAVALGLFRAVCGQQEPCCERGGTQRSHSQRGAPEMVLVDEIDHAVA